MTLGRLILIAIVLVSAASAPGSARPQPREEGRVLGGEEVARRLAQRGYRDIAQPQRRGQIYLVEVTDRDGARRVLVVTVTEALVVGDGPAQRSGARVPGSAIPTTVARE